MWAVKDGGGDAYLVDPDGGTDYRMSVPKDPANRDYQEVMRLVAEEGLVIAPADPPPIPTYRELRARDYIAQLGVDPTFQNTVGDVLDALIKAHYGDAVELDAMKVTIDAIKAAHPKPAP